MPKNLVPWIYMNIVHLQACQNPSPDPPLVTKLVNPPPALPQVPKFCGILYVTKFCFVPLKKVTILNMISTYTYLRVPSHNCPIVCTQRQQSHILSAQS